MILMLAPAPYLAFGIQPSGRAYVSDQNSLVRITNDSVDDQVSLMSAGCYTLSPVGSWGNFGFSVLTDLYAADIVTNLLLPGTVGYPQNCIATVTNDGGNTGSWVKTGSGNGTGNWTLFSALTPAGQAAAVTAAVAAVAAVTAQVNLNSVNAAAAQLYNKPGDVWQPFIVDPAGFVLIAYNPITGAFKMLMDQASVLRAIASAGAHIKIYSGTDSVLPLSQDLAGNTLIGTRQASGFLVASGYEGIPGASTSTSRIALATADQVALKNYNGMIAYGQSNAVSWGAQPSLSLSQPYSNLTFSGGAQVTLTGNSFGGVAQTAMTATEPLVETDYGSGNPAGDGNTTSGETICTGASSYVVSRALVDGTVATPAGLIIFASAPGHGGYIIAKLLKGFAPGVPSNWYQNFLDHVTKAKAIATSAGKTYGLPAVHLIEGAGDAQITTTRSAYLASVQQFLTDINNDVPTITGQTTPVHLLCNQEADYAANNNGPVLGTMDAVNGSSRIHFVLPEYAFGPQSPLNILHFANTGHFWMARYHGRAWKQLVLEARAPDCIWPLSATAQGTTLRVKFRVPHLPLAIDMVNMAATLQAGFVVTDGTGNVTLTNIQVTPNGDEVQMTLSRALGSSPVVRYALDNMASALWFPSGASGNLRDTTAETFTQVSTGQVFPMWHFCPHFQLSISVLDPSTTEL